MFQAIWRTLFFCFTLVVGWSIYQFVIRPSGAFAWDEAAHALRGLLIAHDLKGGNWFGFLFDTYRQVYWPPLHSWFTGIAFLLWQPSPIVARTVSLIAFLLTAPVIYLAGLRFRQPQKEVAATVATLLFLTSPPLVLFSAQAMLEIPGLFFLSLSLLIYIWLHSTPHSPSAHVWLGIAIVLTYFTRTNYGILLIVVMAIAAALDSSYGRISLFSRPNIYTVLPLVAAFAIWFAYPPKIRSTFNALVNEPFGMQHPYSLEGFFYYPKVMLHLSGTVWQSAVLLLALLIVAFKCWRNPVIRFLVILTVVLFGLGLVHHQRVERHMFPMVPALALITGFVFAEWWNTHQNAAPWLPRLATLALCLSAVTTFAHVLRPFGVIRPRDIVESVAGTISRSNSSLVLSTDIKKPLAPLLDWQLSVEKGLLPITHAGAVINLDENRKFWGLVRDRNLPSWLKNNLKRVLLQGEEPGKCRSLYFGLPPEASYWSDPQKFGAFLRDLYASNPLESVIVITPLKPNDGSRLDFVDGGIRAIGLEYASTQSLADSDVQLLRYQRIP